MLEQSHFYKWQATKQVSREKSAEFEEIHAKSTSEMSYLKSRIHVDRAKVNFSKSVTP